MVNWNLYRPIYFGFHFYRKYQNYKEKAVQNNPIINASGYGWNKTGMHNIDPHKLESGKWIACVDGYQIIVVFGIKLQAKLDEVND
ncbi:hypothetical protein [Nostoc sp.]|uniref:hypothetical protein n=1 Tax=Nostoc sp. TaxID=1180 RepID=UPI002FFB38A6